MKTYEIVAVRPLNQNVFDHACEKTKVDIISIDFSDKVPFRLKLPMVKAAIKLLVDWTREKNLIFSSAAPSVCEVRGPNDVANLATLLGLSIERAKAAISQNCRNLLASALRRKDFFQEVIRVEVVSSSGPFDSGKLWSADWLNWDPISSGEVNDLISGPKAAPQSLAKVKNILSTTEPVQLPLQLIRCLKSPASSISFLKQKKASLDDTPSEHLTSLFGDSQKLYLASGATKTSTDSEEVVTNTTTTEEEPETHNGADIVFTSVETESNELNAVMPNENMTSQTSAMDIEPDAACNAAALEISPPSKDNSLPPNQNIYSESSKGSHRDSGEETIKVDDVAVDMLMDMEHQENTSLSLNNVSLLEIFSERILLRGPGDDAVITDQILFQQSDDMVKVKDDSLVANHENRVELVMEEQKHAKGDGKMNDSASVLSDESLRENILDRESTTIPGDDGGLGGWNPFPESNAEMKRKDILSALTNEIHEVASEGQKHVEHHSKNNDPTLG
ncbi:hypothetical protein CRYUN_Cryun02cG0195800 [Craigia yunnanensis]